MYIQNFEEEKKRMFVIEAFFLSQKEMEEKRNRDLKKGKRKFTFIFTRKRLISYRSN